MYIKEDNALLDKTEFKYIILPRDITARDIHDKYPEVIFTGEMKRTLEDAMEYIKYYKKEGFLYALRLGYENEWLIGGYLNMDESLKESNNMTQCVAKFIKQGNTRKFVGIVEENTRYKNQNAMDKAYKNRLNIEDDNVVLSLAYHPGEVFDGKELYDAFGERYTNIG